MKIWMVSIIYFQRALIPKRPHLRSGCLGRPHTATNGHRRPRTASDSLCPGHPAETIRGHEQSKHVLVPKRPRKRR